MLSCTSSNKLTREKNQRVLKNIDNPRNGWTLESPPEFVFQEQSYSSNIDDPCGAIADFCGVIADFCGVIADPYGVVAIPFATPIVARLAKHIIKHC